VWRDSDGSLITAAFEPQDRQCRREHIDQAQRRTIAHEGVRQFGAVLVLAGFRFLERAIILSTLTASGFPYRKDADRASGPGSANRARFIVAAALVGAPRFCPKAQMRRRTRQKNENCLSTFSLARSEPSVPNRTPRSGPW
jgi:hypothetical protein